MNVPDAVGVPLIVIVFDNQEALTPDGKPLAVPIPVAPLVLWVIDGIDVLIQTVGLVDAVPTVLVGVTVI